MDFDAIVVGSGMSGGIAAKELCERGLKVLLLERGNDVDPAKDFTDMVMPWEYKNNNMVPQDEVARDYAVQSQCYAFNETSKHFWVKDSEHPYSTPQDRPFTWIRGYHVGGARSCGGGRRTACRKWISKPMPRMAMAATGRSAMKTWPHGTTM